MSGQQQQGTKRDLEEVLRTATQEIARAAVNHTNTIPVDSLAELRCIHGNTDVLIKKLGDSATILPAKAAEVTTAINDLKVAVVNVGNSITKMSKVQSLQFALLNSGIGEFKYSETPQRIAYQEKTSKTLLPSILLSFMRGTGVYVEGYTGAPHNVAVTAAVIAKARTDFETALCDQIHGLTGTRPRIAAAQSDSAKPAIYYE